MTAEAFVAHVRQQIIEMQTEVRSRVGRPPILYD